jgi:hypothetical protein
MEWNLDDLGILSHPCGLDLSISSMATCQNLQWISSFIWVKELGTWEEKISSRNEITSLTHYIFLVKLCNCLDLSFLCKTTSTPSHSPKTLQIQISLALQFQDKCCTISCIEKMFYVLLLIHYNHWRTNHNLLVVRLKIII